MRITTPEDAIFAYRAVMTTQQPPHPVSKPLKRIMWQVIEDAISVTGDVAMCEEDTDGYIWVNSDPLADTWPGDYRLEIPQQQFAEAPILDAHEKRAVLRAVKTYAAHAKDSSVKRQAELFFEEHKVSPLQKVVSMLVG